MSDDQEEIDVKTAVRSALAFVRELYEDEEISNLGLEEVDLEETVWHVTVGFSRPWDYPAMPSPLIQANIFQKGVRPRPAREYKVVRVDSNGVARGMENRGSD